MPFESAFKTDVGSKRKQNQDNGQALPELGCFIVADGMGGHKGGETASAIAVEVIAKTVSQGVELPGWDARQLLKSAIEKASEAVFARAAADPSLQEMGTTTVALLFQNNKAFVGNVGDSRCYFIRPGQLWQVTADHSLVQEKLRAGLIKREQVKNDRMKNVITRSVGYQERVIPDVYEMSAAPGDLFLLCSDGLSGMIGDDEMLQILEKHAFGENDLRKAADELIRIANSHGGDDNITVLIARIAVEGNSS